MSNTRGYERSPRKPLGSKQAYSDVLEGARILSIRNALPRAKENCVKDAASVIRESQSSSRRQEYRVFLFDLLQKCGPQAVLLCAAELGQHKIMTMRKSDRAALLEKLETNKESPMLQSPIVAALAETCELI